MTVLRGLTMSIDSEASRQRLQKVLSAAGLVSRRHAEKLMQEGRIRINGEVANQMGMRVDPDVDVVSIDGKVVPLRTSSRYIMLHKPPGVVSTMSDEQGRPDLSRYLEEIGERVVNVGRLDAETTGLLLMTNDGDLVHRLSHPSFEVAKVYSVTVQGEMSKKTLQKLCTGVELEDGITAADRVKLLGKPGGGRSIIDMVLHSGKNRVIRRMLDAVGHPVLDLHRKAVGGLHLGGLKPGAWRDLSTLEVKNLLTIAHHTDASPKESPNERQE